MVARHASVFVDDGVERLKASSAQGACPVQACARNVATAMYSVVKEVKARKF